MFQLFFLFFCLTQLKIIEMKWNKKNKKNQSAGNLHREKNKQSKFHKQIKPGTPKLEAKILEHKFTYIQTLSYTFAYTLAAICIRAMLHSHTHTCQIQNNNKQTTTTKCYKIFFERIFAFRKAHKNPMRFWLQKRKKKKK